MPVQKKKKVEIELDSAWILKHRYDDELPIAVISSELSKDSTLTIKGTTLTSIVIYTEQSFDCNKLKKDLAQLIKNHYPDDNPDGVVTINVDEVEVEVAANKTEEKPEEASDEDSEEDSEENPDEAAARVGAEQKAKVAKYIDEVFGGLSQKVDDIDKPKDALGKINALVGVKEFKALAKEIADISDEIKSSKTYDVFINQCYLFSIGDGCGLTTYLELFAELIEEKELCNMSTDPVREKCLGEYSESEDPFKEVYRTLDSGSSKNIKVICVDISEWMDQLNNRYFKQFLRCIEKHTSEFIVVFRVPFVDKDILEKIKYSLSDLLSVKAVSFPPLSQNEMKVYAEEQLHHYKFTITKSAWKYFFNRISEEKSDGKFYGINTVKKVIRELVYQKHISNAKKDKKSNIITANDTKTLCFNSGDSNLSGMEQLNRLVGIDSVKSKIEEIIAQIELSLKNGSEQRPCIHMRFVGNPGTGKTTVARIIGKILKEKGVLRVGAFFEYAGRDFCGRYIGETAPKTASICRDAYGSVLFVDEAYSLYRGDGDTRDYGREAIDTLIAEMENHRNDFVVIMAGYTDDMDKLMQGNFGLASRMPYVIEFPNFTREQLYDIFVSMLNNKFKYDSGLLEAVHSFFMNLPEDILSSKEFSNARYVRNLFERTWAKAAMRCQLSGKTEIVLTRDDFEHASADNEFVTNVAKKSRIGF